MTKAVNYRELKRLYETMGSKEVCRHLRDSLANNDLRPEDFSLRDLAEATIPDGREFVRLLDPRSKAGGIDLMEAADAVDTATFSNITGQIVFSKIMEGFSSEAFVASRMVETVPTRFSGEKIPGIGQMGDVAESIDEGKPYPNVGVTEDYIETPATTKRGMIVPVTKEAIFFDRTHLVLQWASEVGEFLGLNKEKRLLDCIIDANVTDHRYKWRGAIYATYQTSAPWINVKSSNPLVDWTDVDAAEQLLANITDPNTGEPVLIMADTILVCPELLHSARRIIDATEIEQVDNQANAKTVRTFAPNPMAGSYRVQSSRLLRSRLSAASQATSNWYLGNFRKAFAYMENWPITVTQAPQNSEAEFTRHHGAVQGERARGGRDARAAVRREKYGVMSVVRGQLSVVRKRCPCAGRIACVQLTTDNGQIRGLTSAARYHSPINHSSLTTMSNRIRRHHRSLSGVAVTTSVTTTAEIDFVSAAGGCVIVPAGAAISALACYGAREPGAAFVAIQDSTGSPVTQSVSAGNGYPLPDACFGYGALKLVGDAAGSVDLSLKG